MEVFTALQNFFLLALRCFCWIVAGTSSVYASTDALGSIRALTDDAGQVVAQYDYDSYGNPQATVDGVQPQPFRYTGRLYDATTGLYHYRAREYDRKHPAKAAGADGSGGGLSLRGFPVPGQQIGDLF
ncbi:MAG: hypothetical protein ABL901_21495, partial [Hyphomicrobiaceae bacterium]